ncbi:MAG: Pycsar system effector family protein [Pseudomonadota bacterium]
MSRMMDFEGRTGAVAYIHQQAAASLAHLDAKATIFSGLATGALVYLSSLEGFGVLAALFGAPLRIHETFAGLGWRDWVNFGLVAAAIFIFVLVFVFSMLCLKPRSGNKAGGVIYFRSIAQRADDIEYASEIAGMDEAALAEQLSRDTYFLAKIVNRKYRTAAWAATLLWPAAFLLIGAKMTEVAFSLAAPA